MSHIYGSAAIHRGIAALKKRESCLLCLPTPNYTRVLNAKSLWQESLVRTLWKDKRLMSKNTASEKRLKTTEQSGNVTTTAIGDRFKKIQQTPKQSGQHSHSQQIQDNRKEAKTVRPTQPQPTDSRQNRPQSSFTSSLLPESCPPICEKKKRTCRGQNFVSDDCGSRDLPLFLGLNTVVDVGPVSV